MNLPGMAEGLGRDGQCNADQGEGPNQKAGLAPGSRTAFGYRDCFLPDHSGNVRQCRHRGPPDWVDLVEMAPRPALLRLKNRNTAPPITPRPRRAKGQIGTPWREPTQ